MAGKSSLTASFDALLDENKRALDALLGKSHSRSASAEARPSAPAVPPAAHQPAETASERWLNQHYGNRWRVETSHRRKDGDEIIVLCRLTLLDSNIRRAQFGRASLTPSSTGGAPAISGTAGGINFSLGHNSAPETAIHTEDAAFAAAREDGLKNCIASL